MAKAESTITPPDSRRSVPYGKELILDLHNCQCGRVTRNQLWIFFRDLCELISMEREDLHFWDYVGRDDEYCEAPTHLKGTSAVQFIKTSNITIHTLDEMRRVYLNVFSCKPFEPDAVVVFARSFFSGVVIQRIFIDRK